MVVRSFHFTVGVVATGLAVLGVILPLLPTTPFLLVAVWAFARSSPRLETWLTEHARFGPLIADWSREGAIDGRVKRLSAVVMVATVVLGALAGLSFSILALQTGIFAAVSVFLWTRPEPHHRPERGGKG
ncbi:MAG: YbaN family protein [Siculibacillus sp.]|nr:YbaN family protein [Siculibacillus sp.]